MFVRIKNKFLSLHPLSQEGQTQSNENRSLNTL